MRTWCICWGRKGCKKRKRKWHRCSNS